MHKNQGYGVCGYMGPLYIMYTCENYTLFVLYNFDILFVVEMILCTFSYKLQ